MTADSSTPAKDNDSVGSSVFQVPKDTTPTWEVELLLSGALVFSMLQVPGLLDQLMFALRPRLSGSLSYGAFMLYFYLKITSYALIGTFVLHLASRAIWVAALGLRSVYPGGIDWDKLSRGPIYREYARRTTLTLDQMIDRADNRASLVFAFGLLLVLMSLAIMVFSVALIALGGLMEHWWFAGSRNPWPTWVMMGCLLLPMLLATFIDRRFGARIPPGHGLARAMRAVFRISSWLVWGRLTYPIMLTVFSRLGMTRGNLLIAGLLYSLMGVILIEILLRSGAISLPGERYLPSEAGARELKSAYYDGDRSERQAFDGQPYIPAQIVEGAYLRLFVPYVPKRIEAAIERDCSAVEAVVFDPDPDTQRAGEAARTDALLECAATHLHPVAIDGQPIATLSYDIAQDPKSGLRGFLAMIDVRALAPGRHELKVDLPTRPGQEEEAQPWIIPFWR